jgi:hypothetical protein
MMKLVFHVKFSGLLYRGFHLFAVESELVLEYWFIADYHVLLLFMAKKHDLSEKNSVCHAPSPL